MAKLLKDQQGKVLIYNNKAIKNPEELQNVIDSIIDRSITSIESSVTSIGSYAFAFCTSLTSVSFPNATSIGGNAFRGCSSLASIEIPKATSIGNYAFYYCSKLQSIEIPNATSIGEYAFYYCSKLQSIEIPNATSIGEYAFNSCSRLTSIEIPNVETIKSNALSYCKGISSIRLPKVKTIEKSAFEHMDYCYLFDFREATAVPTLNHTQAFHYTPSTKKIVVPDALYDTWITSTNWSDYNIRTTIIKASDYEASL